MFNVHFISSVILLIDIFVNTSIIVIIAEIVVSIDLVTSLLFFKIISTLFSSIFGASYPTDANEIQRRASKVASL